MKYNISALLTIRFLNNRGLADSYNFINENSMYVSPSNQFNQLFAILGKQRGIIEFTYININICDNPIEILT